MEGFLGVLLLVFSLYCPLLEIILPTPLINTCQILQNQTFRYTCHITPKRVTCFRCPYLRHSAKAKQLPALMLKR